MLDIRLIKDDLENIIEKLNTRGGNHSYLRETVKKDQRRRDLIKEVESLKNTRNLKSKEIGELARQNKPIDKERELVKTISDNIKELDAEIEALENDIKEDLSITPNIPLEDVPIGLDEEDNEVRYERGTIRQFDFEIKDHVTLGENLDILDFQRATKIAGARFVINKGLGAKLERSLIQFMMDLHNEDHGYTEIIPPYIVNEESMYATGQFPKFKEDSFKVGGADSNWYLNPTAEVPTINMYRDEILNGDDHLNLCVLQLV